MILSNQLKGELTRLKTSTKHFTLLQWSLLFISVFSNDVMASLSKTNLSAQPALSASKMRRTKANGIFKPVQALSMPWSSQGLLFPFHAAYQVLYCSCSCLKLLWLFAGRLRSGQRFLEDETGVSTCPSAPALYHMTLWIQHILRQCKETILRQRDCIDHAGSVQKSIYSNGSVQVFELAWSVPFFFEWSGACG